MGDPVASRISFEYKNIYFLKKTVLVILMNLNTDDHELNQVILAILPT